MLLVAAHALERGIIIADTKFEFGMLGGAGAGELILIDETQTSNSSRLPPAESCEPGRAQAEQFVRDYLGAFRRNKEPPASEQPAEIAEQTREKCWEAVRRLAQFMGLDWAHVKQVMARPIVLDGRSAVNAASLTEPGFT